MLQGLGTRLDISFVLEDLSLNAVEAKRMIVYCRSLNMCSALYSHFLYTLGDKSCHPPGAEHISDNILYNYKKEDHNKEAIMAPASMSSGVRDYGSGNGSELHQPDALRSSMFPR